MKLKNLRERPFKKINLLEEDDMLSSSTVGA